MDGFLAGVIIRRLDEQANSARIRAEIRGEVPVENRGVVFTGRRCAAPGCGRYLRKRTARTTGDATGFCAYHWHMSQAAREWRAARRQVSTHDATTSTGGTMATMAVAKPQQKPKQITAYTIRRVKGGGWRMLTILADELSIVAETDVDSRQAQMTRIDDALRALE